MDKWDFCTLCRCLSAWGPGARAPGPRTGSAEEEGHRAGSFVFCGLLGLLGLLGLPRGAAQVGEDGVADLLAVHSLSLLPFWGPFAPNKSAVPGPGGAEP